MTATEKIHRGKMKPLTSSEAVHEMTQVLSPSPVRTGGSAVDSGCKVPCLMTISAVRFRRFVSMGSLD